MLIASVEESEFVHKDNTEHAMTIIKTFANALSTNNIVTCETIIIMLPSDVLRNSLSASYLSAFSSDQFTGIKVVGAAMMHILAEKSKQMLLLEVLSCTECCSGGKC